MTVYMVRNDLKDGFSDSKPVLKVAYRGLEPRKPRGETDPAHGSDLHPPEAKMVQAGQTGSHVRSKKELD